MARVAEYEVTYENGSVRRKLLNEADAEQLVARGAKVRKHEPANKQRKGAETKQGGEQ